MKVIQLRIFTDSKMPLPDYGYSNMEKKTHQDIVFEMAPEIVSDEDDTKIVNGKNVKRVRGKVTGDTERNERNI